MFYFLFLHNGSDHSARVAMTQKTAKGLITLFDYLRAKLLPGNEWGAPCGEAGVPKDTAGCRWTAELTVVKKICRSHQCGLACQETKAFLVHRSDNKRNFHPSQQSPGTLRRTSWEGCGLRNLPRYPSRSGFLHSFALRLYAA